MTKKIRRIASCIINSFIVVSTTYIMISYATQGDANPVGEIPSGIYALRAFTNLSNIFCAIIALLLIFFPQCPTWLRKIQFASTTAVFLTFTIVMIFLNPLYAINTGEVFGLFSGRMLFTHLVNPLLSIIVFIFLTPSKYEFKNKDCLINFVPVLCYGIIYFLNVLVFKTWTDFYNFTFGGQVIFVPIVIIAIFGVTIGLSKILALCNRKFKTL